MTPDFTLLLVSGMVSCRGRAWFCWVAFWPAGRAGGWSGLWRFHSGHGFPLCVCDAELRGTPGQSPLWVFTYIFFGWIGMCGTVCSSPKASWPDHIKTCSRNPSYGGRCRLPPVQSP